jgi:uncharacterized membrane protein YphA (DoxX/SURF4 family)
MTDLNEQRRYWPWAILLTRGLLGLIFFMAGWWKVFDLGPIEHARKLFIEPYAGTTWIPVWLLWATGTVIPFLELAAGALMLLGLWVQLSMFTLGSILLLVTYGHLLKEALYDTTGHIFPRSILLLILLLLPRSEDRWSLDAWLIRRRGPR